MTARCLVQSVRVLCLPPALAAVVIVLGCADVSDDRPAESTAGSAGADAISDTVEHGPATLTVRAQPATVQVGSKVQLTIDVTTEQGITVMMPELGEQLGAFEVRSRRTPPDVPENGRRHWTHVYTLDTFATGDVEIPTIELSFTDAREATVAERGGPLDTSIATDPLTVHVQSVLSDDESETDYRDIREAVEVPVPGGPFNWWVVLLAAGVAAVAAALVAGALALLMRRSKGKPAAPPVPAHVQAQRALDELAAAGLIERGGFHEFYTRLSGIVRTYIERRFGLMAPERTTDEFLREAERDARLSEAHRALLTDFLRAADMVKFARFEPGPDDAHAALEAARGFVAETAPHESLPATEGAAS